MGPWSLVGPFSRTGAALTHGLERVDDSDQATAVVDVGFGQDDGERQAPSVDHEVALGPRLAAVGRDRPDLIAPL